MVEVVALANMTVNSGGQSVVMNAGQTYWIAAADAHEHARAGYVRILAQPGRETATAPAYETATAPAQLAIKRGLIDISGIGIIELDVLAGLGIRDFAALAEADIKTLATALGTTQKSARAMIGDAVGFLG